LTGKVKECVNRRDADGRPVYDAVVLDAPPTGRVVKFLDVTKAMAELARTGPIHGQAAGVVEVLHSPLTAVHLVTLLEDLPVTETLETVDELTEAGFPVGSVIVNRVRKQWLPDRSVAAAAGGRVDAGRIRAGLASAGLDLPAEVIDGLVAETVEHAVRVNEEAAASARLEEASGLPRLELPELVEGVDLGSLYELAEALRDQGVGEQALAESRSSASAPRPCWTSTPCWTTRTRGSSCAAAPAASARPPPRPPSPSAPPSAAGAPWSSPSTRRAGSRRRSGWRRWATSPVAWRGRAASSTR